MAHKRQQPRPAIDLEEIAPGRFVVNHPQLRGLLKDEGIFKGQIFELTTWRREGLLARLRARNFRVRTLAEQIEALPAPPHPPRGGATGWRAAAGRAERLSYFDPRALDWRPLDVEEREGTAGVPLRSGWAIRRRAGRGGPASFYMVVPARNGVELQPVDETNAILAGYAAAVAADDRPLIVERRAGEGGESRDEVRLLLPKVELPPAYRELLRKIAEPGPEGPLTDRRGWPLAEALFNRLGLRLTIARD